jgi:hypothetical protein
MIGNARRSGEGVTAASLWAMTVAAAEKGPATRSSSSNTRAWGNRLWRSTRFGKPNARAVDNQMVNHQRATRAPLLTHPPREDEGTPSGWEDPAAREAPHDQHQRRQQGSTVRDPVGPFPVGD